ncbi:MAG: SMC-Scp complex subunit ScpB [Candidatus Kapaibacterium sp.]
MDLQFHFLTLDRDSQMKAVEAVIFTSDEPLSLRALYDLLIGSYKAYMNGDFSKEQEEAGQFSLEDEVVERFGFTRELLVDIINDINKELDDTDRPYRIVNYAGGYQFATNKEYGELVQALVKSKIRKRLSQAALEALAIIAYRQPVSKPEIEQIRGVNSNEIVNSLIEKNLVKITGRSESLGKPLLYGTTDEFLKTFGLTSLKDLPKLRELEDLAESDIDNSIEKKEFTIKVVSDDILEYKGGLPDEIDIKDFKISKNDLKGPH